MHTTSRRHLSCCWQLVCGRIYGYQQRPLAPNMDHYFESLAKVTLLKEQINLRQAANPKIQNEIHWMFFLLHENKIIFFSPFFLPVSSLKEKKICQQPQLSLNVFLSHHLFFFYSIPRPKNHLFLSLSFFLWGRFHLSYITCSLRERRKRNVQVAPLSELPQPKPTSFPNRRMMDIFKHFVRIPTHETVKKNNVSQLQKKKEKNTQLEKISNMVSLTKLDVVKVWEWQKKKGGARSCRPIFIAFFTLWFLSLPSWGWMVKFREEREANQFWHEMSIRPGERENTRCNLPAGRQVRRKRRK